MRRYRTATLSLAMVATAVAVAIVLGGIAFAASVEPELRDPWTSGNAGSECAAIGGGYTYSYKIDDWEDIGASGSFEAHFDDGHHNEISISNNDGTYFDWSASPNPIGAVIVKGGPPANVFNYDPQSYGDTDLYSPTNPNNGNIYEVSHATFCWNLEEDQCFEDETGWGRGDRYVRRGNWAMYMPWEEGKCRDLVAGRTMIAGEVCFGNNEIYINLDDGWYFGYIDENGQSYEETIHIQGYESTPPKRNPAPGRFRYKFDVQGQESGRLAVGYHNYVGVHTALLHEVACP